MGEVLAVRDAYRAQKWASEQMVEASALQLVPLAPVLRLEHRVVYCQWLVLSASFEWSFHMMLAIFCLLR